jgi:hypothetical protein
MRRSSILLCHTLLASFCHIANAEESWLLLSHPTGEDTVVLSDGSSLRTIAAPGRVVSYGQSARTLGFLSYEVALARHVLTLIDKPTQEVTATALVDMSENVQPVQWMTGAILNLVLTDQFAYFVSFGRPAGESGVARNPSGGLYDLDRVRLTDGKLDQFPLPKDCVNPRVVDFEGAPLVYSWEGFGVCKLDVAKRTAVTLVSTADVRDIIEREGDAKYRRRGPETAVFADYILVPGAGAFRLSRVGELQQVLNADLTPVNRPRRSVRVASEGEHPELLLGRFRGAPAIGVVRTFSDHLDFKYFDPVAFDVEWEATLPRSASIASLYGSSDNALVYLDQATASINQLTEQRATIMEMVDTDEAQYGVRILSIDTAEDRN